MRAAALLAAASVALHCDEEPHAVNPVDAIAYVAKYREHRVLWADIVHTSLVVCDIGVDPAADAAFAAFERRCEGSTWSRLRGCWRSLNLTEFRGAGCREYDFHADDGGTRGDDPFGRTVFDENLAEWANPEKLAGARAKQGFWKEAAKRLDAEIRNTKADAKDSLGFDADAEEEVQQLKPARDAAREKAQEYKKDARSRARDVKIMHKKVYPVGRVRQEEVFAALAEARSCGHDEQCRRRDYNPGAYDLFRHNCHTFTEFLMARLRLPAWAPGRGLPARFVPEDKRKRPVTGRIVGGVAAWTGATEVPASERCEAEVRESEARCRSRSVLSRLPNINLRPLGVAP